MTAAVSPAVCLRQAEAIPESAENFLMLRELIHSLKDLVELTKDTK